MNGQPVVPNTKSKNLETNENVFWDKDKYDFPEEKSFNQLGKVHPAKSSVTSCRKMMFELNTLEGKKTDSLNHSQKVPAFFPFQDQDFANAYNKKMSKSLFKKGGHIT